MMDELQRHLPHFPGEASRTRCFCHIINLVAKSIITQFDVPPLLEEIDDEDVEDAEERQDLELLAGMEGEEEEEQLENDQEENENDDDEGWIDERIEMPGIERRTLEKAVLPP